MVIFIRDAGAKYVSTSVLGAKSVDLYSAAGCSITGICMHAEKLISISVFSPLTVRRMPSIFEPDDR